MRRCASCTAACRRGEASRPPARGRCGSGPPTPAIPGSLPPAASPAPTPATAPATTSPTSTPPTAIPVTQPPPRSWAPRPTSTAGCGTAPNTRPSPPPATPGSSPASSRSSPPASTDQRAPQPLDIRLVTDLGHDHVRFVPVRATKIRDKSGLLGCPAPRVSGPPGAAPDSLRGAVAASAGGLEDEQVAGADRYRVAAGHGDDGAVRALDPVPPQRPGRAARHPVR